MNITKLVKSLDADDMPLNTRLRVVEDNFVNFTERETRHAITLNGIY